MFSRNLLSIVKRVLAMGFFCLGLSPLWAIQEVKSVPVNHVFSPLGFDDNDVTQIIVSGYLPNMCFKSPQAAFSIEGTNISLQMTALYEETPNTLCVQATIPFLEVVSVGVLKEGTYSIKVNDGFSSFLQDQIKVVKAENLNVNDHVYAAVDYVERKNTSRIVTLKGYNPSDCFELDHVEYISNDKDTYSVLPIMKKIRNFCPMKLVPFEYETEIPSSLAADVVLLHVRVMKGNSVNSLFDNRLHNR